MATTPVWWIVASMTSRRTCAIANRRERAERLLSQQGAEDHQNTPELQALSDEMMRRHWEAWLDERVPALGNKTPRQAARTTKGRERLLALLGEFDRRAESEPAATREALRDVRRRLKME